MKHILLYIALLLTPFAVAQSNPYKGKLTITPLQLERVGDSLRVGIDFDAQGVEVRSIQSIHLIPMLVGPSGTKQLPEVVIRGLTDFLTAKREVTLMSDLEWQAYAPKRPYATVKGYKSSGAKQVFYQTAVAYEPWMNGARLELRQELGGCGKTPHTLAISKLIDPLYLQDFTPCLAYVRPGVEAVKMRETVGEAFLEFVVSETEILPHFRNNARELKKITDMMAELGRNPAVEVLGVGVLGSASPEGPEALNRQLAEGRARALTNHLQAQLDYPQEMYRIEAVDEDWSGLIALIEQGDMAYKSEVLVLLNERSITNQQCKKLLQQLWQGEPYRYMLQNYYPSLRKAVCTIDYRVKGFDLEAAKAEIKSQPKNLSLEELFLVANSYAAGSQEFVATFETAAQLFAADPTANLNAAIAALSRKDLIQAQHYLDQIKSSIHTAEHANALGVLAMFKGAYVAAREFFQTAEASGLEAARLNLEHLKQLIK